MDDRAGDAVTLFIDTYATVSSDAGDFELGIEVCLEEGMAAGALGWIFTGMVDGTNMRAEFVAQPIHRLDEGTHIGGSIFISAGECPVHGIDGDMNDLVVCRFSDGCN